MLVVHGRSVAQNPPMVGYTDCDLKAVGTIQCLRNADIVQ
jgi:hypothetical protein